MEARISWPSSSSSSSSWPQPKISNSVVTTSHTRQKMVIDSTSPWLSSLVVAPVVHQRRIRRRGCRYRFPSTVIRPVALVDSSKRITVALVIVRVLVLVLVIACEMFRLVDIVNPQRRRAPTIVKRTMATSLPSSTVPALMTIVTVLVDEAGEKFPNAVCASVSSMDCSPRPNDKRSTAVDPPV